MRGDSQVKSPCGEHRPLVAAVSVIVMTSEAFKRCGAAPDTADKNLTAVIEMKKRIEMESSDITPRRIG
jgi:hypothetical protein